MSLPSIWTMRGVCTTTCVLGWMLSAATAGAAKHADATRDLANAGEAPHPALRGMGAGVTVDGRRIAMRNRDLSQNEGGESAGIDGWTLRPVHADATDLRTTVAALAMNGDRGFVSPVFIDAAGEPAWVTPFVLVGFERDLDRAAQEALLDDFEDVRSVEYAFAGMKQVLRLETDLRDGWAVLDFCEALAATPGVRYAEPDLVVTGRLAAAPEPNDPLFADQWALNHTGQYGNATGFDLQALDAWEISRGDPNVLVAIFDVGVQETHPDLNIVEGVNFADLNDPNGPAEPGGGPDNECDNHGTWVAGNISAVQGNGIGVSGVAPGVFVTSARIGVSNIPCNLTFRGQLSWTARAIMWAEQVGARISNNSNGYSLTSTAIRDAYELTRDNGMVHFASAGNAGVSSIDYPAELGAVNAVGALDPNGHRAFFSNYGGQLAFLAPGQDTWTTDRTGQDGKDPTNYAMVDGTSFSSPLAAGVAALLVSIQPALSAIDVEQIMRRTSRDLYAPGKDSDSGWGLVQARAALELAACYLGWEETLPVGSEPASRTNHAVVYDAAADRMVLFGGLRVISSNNETWLYQSGAWTDWNATPAGMASLKPSARYGHAMAYDAARGVTVLFGGFAGASASNETWEFDGTSWQLVAMNGPAARYLHAMTYDESRGVTVLFGGRDAGGSSLGDTWEWNGLFWLPRTLPGDGKPAPAARNYHAMAFDAARGVTVLHGGTTGADETWEWDGTDWTLVHSGVGIADGPGELSRHSMAYDADQGRVVLFGGQRGFPPDEETIGETWTWDGAAWRLWSLAGPAPRTASAMAYDPTDGAVALLGGKITGCATCFDQHRWRFAPPQIVSVMAPVTVNDGDTIELSVAAAAVGAPAYQWLLDGAALADNGRVTGAQAAALTIDNAGDADSGAYRVRVTHVCGTAESAPVEISVGCVGDLDGDDDADSSDLSILLTHFGTLAGATPTDGDIDGDGDVDATDLSLLLARFGQICGGA